MTHHKTNNPEARKPRSELLRERIEALEETYLERDIANARRAERVRKIWLVEDDGHGPVG